MNITKKHLRELIREVLQEITRVNSSIYESELEELVTFAQLYGSLSSSAQHSLGLLIKGDWDDVSPEDVEEIRSRLMNTNQEVDMMLSAWDDEMGGDFAEEEMVA